MTTTGGPEHFLADPATKQATPGDPVVLGGAPDRLEGDDIVVEPASPQPPPRHHARVLIVAIVITALVATAVAVALATRDTGHTSSVRSVAPVRPPAAHPTPRPPAVNRHVSKTPRPKAPVQIAKPTPISVSPPVSVAASPAPAPAVSAATTPAVIPPTPPPVTAPPTAPPSVLRWTASPPGLTVKGGAQASVTVTVVNPTNATVTLPLELSCAPTLRGPNGAVIGSAVCAQVAQLVSPHSKLSQRYTIYATDTADANGNALKPGTYIASFENLFRIKVIVGAS